MIVQVGNFTEAVIDHVFGVITTSRNGATDGSFEDPMILVVALV